MASKDCCSNPPVLDPCCGMGTVVDDIGGVRAYTAGSSATGGAIILASDVFGYEVPHLRKLADEVASAGFFVVVPDFFSGDYYDSTYEVLDDWIKRHDPVKAVPDANAVVKALKARGTTAIGAAGFCWGGKVVVELAKSRAVDAVALLHPSFVTVNDIQEVIVPIEVLCGSHDKSNPEWLLKQYDLILSAKTSIDSFVKIFPGAPHGFALRYEDDDEVAVKAAEEAHNDMLNWFLRHIRSHGNVFGVNNGEKHVIQMDVRLMAMEKRMDAKIRRVEVKLVSLVCFALCLLWLLSLRLPRERFLKDN